MKKAAVPAPRMANIVTAAVAPGEERVFCCRRGTSDGQEGEDVAEALEVSSTAAAKPGSRANHTIPMTEWGDSRRERSWRGRCRIALLVAGTGGPTSRQHPRRGIRDDGFHLPEQRGCCAAVIIMLLLHNDAAACCYAVLPASGFHNRVTYSEWRVLSHFSPRPWLGLPPTPR